MKVLYADPRCAGERFTLVTNRLDREPRVHVAMGGKIPDESVDRVVVIDSGDDRSLQMLREVLEYRERNPDCDLMLLTRVDPSWSPTEVLARVASLRDGSAMRIPEGLVGDVLAKESRVDVRINHDRVLFEYAA